MSFMNLSVAWRRSDHSHFDERRAARTERTAHASGVGSSGIISSDFVNPVPPMLVDVSITGSGARFILPKAGVPVPEIAPADATHVSSLPLMRAFSSFLVFIWFLLICKCMFLLLELGILLWLVHRSISWSLRAHRLYCLLLFDLFIIPAYVNACVCKCMRCDMQCLF